LRTNHNDALRLSAAVAAVLVIATAFAGLGQREVPVASASSYGSLTQEVADERESKATPPTSTPEPRDLALTAERQPPTIGGADLPADAPRNSAAGDPDAPPPSEPDRTPTPTSAPAQYTDEELEALAATLTDGEIYSSGGAFGAKKTFDWGETRIEAGVYPVGATSSNEQGERQTHFHWPVWTPGLVRSTTVDFGDGTTWHGAVDTYWHCSDEDRPFPYWAGPSRHPYKAPGTYTVTARVTTASCDRAAEVGEYGDDYRTYTATITFTLPDGWMLHPNDAGSHPGVRCTRPDCGDFPDGFERPRNVT
jgi:hypothetical protein